MLVKIIWLCALQKIPLRHFYYNTVPFCIYFQTGTFSINQPLKVLSLITDKTWIIYKTEKDYAILIVRK